MSRRRGVGRRRQKPTTAARKLARSYECGHCRSEVTGVRRDEYGIDRISVVHDDGCPVLAGTLPDTPDAFRAAVRAGVAMLAVRVDGSAE